MAMTPELPNRLFADGRSVLARFGFRHLEDDEERTDWAEMWAHLKPDFAKAGRAGVPDYEKLSGEQQEAAREYMRRRLIADRNLEKCEMLHVHLFSGGINTDGVEAYAVARDAYEDSVEAFGEARGVLDRLLDGAAR